MTVAEIAAATEEVRRRRPVKPGPSPFAVIVGLVALGLTVVTVWDWEYGTGFSIRDVFENLTRDNRVIDGLRHPDWSQLWSSERTRSAFLETVYLAILGTGGGALVALPLAMWSTTYGAPNRAIRFVVRIVTNVIRAIPDIVWALLFVALVRIGTLAGLLSLLFFSIAVITKLTADTLDGIDMGPIEAANASGARHSQMLRSAVVPQILPAYTSYALYAFELNLRASAVIGLVGAGGIGQRLNTFRNNGDWEAVWGIVVLFFIVVFVVERISTWLRRRLV